METPNYYAVLPARVRYDGSLRPMEKLLYAELTALSQKDGYCWASNGYFASLYEVAKETVSRWLSNLQKCGYIKMSVSKDAGNERRIIVFEDQYLLTKKSEGIDEKVKDPLDEKVKQNTTSKNTQKEQEESPPDGTIGTGTPDEENPKIREAFEAYVEMRRAKGKPPTPHALDLVGKRLTQLCRSDREKIAVLEQSVINGWTDIYALKEPLPPMEQPPMEITKETDAHRVILSQGQAFDWRKFVP